jgi:ribosomal protein S18 acetylase RimI-like enzyme
MAEQEKPRAIVRPAMIDDAAGIANVHLNSWREAYEGFMPKSYLDSLPLSFQRRMNWWKACLLTPEKGRRLWVAESEKHGVVGFSSIEAPRDAEFAKSGELTCIYLLRAYHGAGIGYQLLRNAFEGVSEQGYDSAYCWVLKDNPSIAFYEKTGAEVLDREKTATVGEVTITERVCYWPSMSQYKV